MCLIIGSKLLQNISYNTSNMLYLWFTAKKGGGAKLQECRQIHWRNWQLSQ